MFANAAGYERFMGRWSAALAPLLVDFGRIPSEGLVLDVGCGSGALTFSIARRHGRVRVRGVDPSQEFVAFAADSNPFPDRVGFEAGDAQALLFPEAVFDACSSLLALNFIASPAEALMEARRVTKPGGWVSAAVWDYGAGMQMLRVFWDAAASLDPGAAKRDERHMPLCRAGELTALWRQTGLEDVYEQPLDLVMPFESFADFWEPFGLGQGPAGAYLQGLDEEARAALSGAVKRRLGLHDPARAFQLTARAWAVRGAVARK